MYVNLVFLLDLKSHISDEDIDQRRGDVFQTGVEGGSKAGIKWNQIHSRKKVNGK